MAEARKLVLNHLLCFATSKYSRVPNRPLKSSIIDFFSPEDITAAKDCLQTEAEALNIDKLVKLPRRRKDSINRVVGEIDDILNLIASIDEAKNSHLLPLFVSSDPDCMPSIKLTDGDLSVVLTKLEKLGDSLKSITQTVGDLKIGQADNSNNAQKPRGPARNLQQPGIVGTSVQQILPTDMTTTDENG